MSEASDAWKQASGELPSWQSGRSRDTARTSKHWTPKQSGAWRSVGRPLDGQDLAAHRRWLGVWQRLELSDLYYFPLWERGVHDALQARFDALCLVFLAYARSALGSDSAADATEMEMAEFHDLVRECRLETRAVSFDVMCTQFVKVNAANSAQARAAV